MQTTNNKHDCSFVFGFNSAGPTDGDSSCDLTAEPSRTPLARMETVEYSALQELLQEAGWLFALVDFLPSAFREEVDTKYKSYFPPFLSLNSSACEYLMCMCVL